MMGAQIRMAHGYLRWSVADLAKQSGVGASTIKRSELAEGIPPLTIPNLRAIRAALEEASVELIEENGDGAGVRRRQRTELRSSSALPVTSSTGPRPRLPNASPEGEIKAALTTRERQTIRRPKLTSQLSLLKLEVDLEDKLRSIRAEILDEYQSAGAYPWIVGFSGGKDSSLVSHLVFEMLLSVSPSQRRRTVHIVANDTLVESPLVIGHIRAVQAQMQAAVEAFNLPVRVVTTTPAADDTFWVNLIGRGYPSPNRSFRWCTDRMKIRPTSHYIREQVDTTGQAILLLGVRRDESSKRAQSIAKYDNGLRLHPHNDLSGCLVFRPIVDLTTDDVWDFLGSTPSPWGGSHAELIALYRNSLGGECPVVVQKSDAPSCGSTSSRFGCWTCTVVQKDRSLEGFVEAGFTEFGPYLEFRDWLSKIRNDPHRRMARRRHGGFTVNESGTFVPGPFTPETRAEILRRLTELQAAVGRELISHLEIAKIRAIWMADAVTAARRVAEISLQPSLT